MPLAVVLLLMGTIAGAGAPALEGERDWRETALGDLEHMRTTLRDNHPGAVDSEFPSFAEWLEEGYTAALDKAAAANSYAGYHFALEYYATGFRDGHLWVEFLDPQLRYAWPGFLTGYDQRGFYVAVRDAETASAPALGTRVVSCDGKSLAEWGEAILQTYVGHWHLRGLRPRLAPYLFVDMGNPFVRRPSRCRFAVDGSERTLLLHWTALVAEEFDARRDAARGDFRQPIAIRRVDGGGYWIALPDFNPMIDEVDAAIDAVLAEMAANAEAMRDADWIVFDVRGNGGGSSEYGRRLAAALWGAATVEKAVPAPEGVDWRVSKGNFDYLASIVPLVEERYGADDDLTVWFRSLLAGYESALEQGELLYREPDDGVGGSTDSEAGSHVVNAPVFLLTDGTCASACLDFADIMIRLPGVVHIGAETNADTNYLEGRPEPLPSGLARLRFAMKVYRGRPRGHNESYRPVHEWHGRIDDTAALEAWVAELPEAAH